MNEEIIKKPITYEDWLELGHVIIPTYQKKAVVKWGKEDFKLTKEEWKTNHSNAQIALRLDNHTDLDVDNPVIRGFVKYYLKECGAIFGRKNNPTSHYLWNGSCDFIQYKLPIAFKSKYEKYPKGQTLCELRHGADKYTIVPESSYNDNGEKTEWEEYTNIHQYHGNLKTDVGKIALSAALTIVYPDSGSRDVFCTAIAGILIKNTDWQDDEINLFVHRIAIQAGDPEVNKRAQKGTTTRKATKIFGIPKLAETLNVEKKDVAFLFSWIGVDQKGEEINEHIGEIVEFGSNRYFINIYGIENEKKIEKQIKVKGEHLLKKSVFYDEVIRQASVFLPPMKEMEFIQMMKAKFENRTKSPHFNPVSFEDVRFIEQFESFISDHKAFTNKAELYRFKMPYYNLKNQSLEFNMSKFDEWLQKKRINMDRADLVIQCQRILKAKIYRGKYKDGPVEKSCVSYRISKYNIKDEDLTIDGEYVDQTEEIKQLPNE